MNIQFRQSPGSIPEKLATRTERYLEKLSRRLDERTAEAYAHIDIDRESGSAHSENMWRASITIRHLGRRYHASSQGTTQAQATDRALREVKRELSASQTRAQRLYREGATMLKRLRREFN